MPVDVRLRIVNPLGLHARAAARFVKVSGGYRCLIRVTKGARTVDGKSILGLLLLAAARGTEIEIHADGADETDAIAALSELVNGGFGEL
jgi:phosphocarrier protein